MRHALERLVVFGVLGSAVWMVTSCDDSAPPIRYPTTVMNPTKHETSDDVLANVEFSDQETPQEKMGDVTRTGPWLEVLRSKPSCTSTIPVSRDSWTWPKGKTQTVSKPLAALLSSEQSHALRMMLFARDACRSFSDDSYHHSLYQDVGVRGVYGSRGLWSKRALLLLKTGDCLKLSKPGKPLGDGKKLVSLSCAGKNPIPF